MERKKLIGFFETVLRFGLQDGRIRETDTFFRKFGIEAELDLSPEQNKLFKNYFAGYLTLKDDSDASYFARFSTVAQFIDRINIGVAGEFMESARQQAEAIDSRSTGSPLNIQNAANLLSHAYVANRGKGQEAFETAIGICLERINAR